MTKQAIEKILNKTSWTGAELGKLYIEIMADLTQQKIKGVTDPTPLIPFDKLREMVGTLKSEKQKHTYNGYYFLYEWIISSNPQCGGLQQQAFVRSFQLTKYLTLAMANEEALSYTGSLPVVMTEEQLKEAKAQGVASLLYDGKKKKEREDNLPVLLLRALHYYSDELAREPNSDNLLKPLREKYRAEGITSRYIKKNYNEATKNGYYQLEDGRRSDQMEQEEWVKLVYPVAYLEAQYKEDSKEAISNECLESTKLRLERELSFIANGLPEELAEALEEAEDLEDGRKLATKWHCYKELPEGLNKWDIVTDPHTLKKCFPNAFSLEADPEAQLKELEDFIAELPELVELLLEDIDRTCLQYIKPATVKQPVRSVKLLSHKEWLECKINWADLYIDDIYGMKAEAEAPENIFRNNERALRNGVAILSKKDSFNYKENYSDPKLESPFNSKMLESFTPESKYYKDNTEVVIYAKELLIKSYYFVKAYDKLIEIIAEYYKLPCLLVFQSKMVASIEETIITYNSLIPALYWSIKKNYFLDPELQQKKIKALKKNFKPIHYKKMELNFKLLDQVKESLKDFLIFRPGQQTELLTSLVCCLPSEYLEGV